MAAKKEIEPEEMKNALLVSGVSVSVMLTQKVKSHLTKEGAVNGKLRVYHFREIKVYHLPGRFRVK